MYVYLHNNEFIRNDCDSLINLEIPTDSFDHVGALFITNNTFVDNTSLLDIRGDSGGPRVRIENNVITAAQEILTIDDGLYSEGGNNFIYEGFSFYSGLSTSRNLVWQSNRGSVLTGSFLKLPGIIIEKSDVNVNPFFTAPTNGNYTLQSGSPAIDAGVPRTPYIWSFSTGAEEDLRPTETAVSPAIDGTLDGIKIIDIGAHEFEP